MIIPGDYVPFGPKWEKEMRKLPKATLIAMLRRAQTGEPRLVEINGIHIDWDTAKEVLVGLIKEHAMVSRMWALSKNDQWGEKRANLKKTILKVKQAMYPEVKL